MREHCPSMCSIIIIIMIIRCHTKRVKSRTTKLFLLKLMTYCCPTANTHALIVVTNQYNDRTVYISTCEAKRYNVNKLEPSEYYNKILMRVEKSLRSN